MSVEGASAGYLLTHPVCTCLGTGWEDNCIDGCEWCLAKLEHVLEWKIGD